MLLAVISNTVKLYQMIQMWHFDFVLKSIRACWSFTACRYFNVKEEQRKTLQISALDCFEKAEIVRRK